MKTNEMRARTVTELHVELDGLLQEQFNLRMQKGMGQMAGVLDLRQVRRTIARIKTVMTEKSQKGNEA